jgi:hypothetical protein
MSHEQADFGTFFFATVIPQVTARGGRRGMEAIDIEGDEDFQSL